MLGSPVDLLPPGAALRLPTWGSGGPTTDLAVAYEKAAGAILSVRPTYLIFAQGLMAGRDLRPARLRPLVLRAPWPKGRVVRGQLAYEAHEYPWLWVGGPCVFVVYVGYVEGILLPAQQEDSK
jgi:hypothetical protein